MARVEATRSYGLAAQTVAYDTNVIIAYADAVVDDQDELATLYRDTLVRREFLPILDRWKAQIARGESPTNLLDDQDYLDELFADHREADERADRHDALSAEAGRIGIDYVVTTLLLAVALFFAGVTHVFRSIGIRASAVLCSGLLVSFAVSRVAELAVI